MTFTQTGFEVIRGLDLTLMHEMKKNDRQESEIAFQAYGPGIRWAPRPHFIMTGQWQKQKVPQYAKAIDGAFFVMQYWL